MERTRSKVASALVWAAMAAICAHNLVFPFHVSALGFEDEKNFYPFPSTVSPPSPIVSYTYTPPAGGHSTPTPSHGGGSDGGTPPAHCGNSPNGAHHSPTTPHDPHGGGYYHSPPMTTAPPTGSTTPVISLSPPAMPGTTGSPPFSCTYWRNHPTLIWGMMGWWGNLGNSFGVGGTIPGSGTQMSLPQALSNTRTDGYGELYREGTAALLNSMAHTKFPYTTEHVRDSFVAALSSNRAAAAQAQLFKLANEGRIKPRA